MLLHPLTNWEVTRDSIHAVSQVMSAIRKAGGYNDPIFHQHVVLVVKRKGLLARTRYGTIMFHWADATMGYVYQRDHAPISIQVEGHTQRSLFAALQEAILLHSREPFNGDDSDLDDSYTLHIDLKQCQEYGQTLKAIHDTFEDFYSSLHNNKTPLVLYPHHFDLSFLWFKGVMNSEEDHHINFGFAPYSDGIDRPYFYTYTYPVPEGYKNIELPPMTQWADRWNGTIMYYDEVITHPFPLATVRYAMRKILGSVAPLIPVETVVVQPQPDYKKGPSKTGSDRKAFKPRPQQR